MVTIIFLLNRQPQKFGTLLIVRSLQNVTFLKGFYPKDGYQGELSQKIPLKHTTVVEIKSIRFIGKINHSNCDGSRN